MPPPLLRSLILEVLACHRSVRESGYLRLFPAHGAVPAHAAAPSALLRTVLLKVQGPLSSHHLSSIGAGVAYLQRLGVGSVIVLDHPASSQSGPPGHGWTTPSDDDTAKREHSVRHQMAGEASRLARALEHNGAEARPLPHALMRCLPPPCDDRSTENTGRALGPVSTAALVPDRDLRSLRAALETNTVPILPPLALHDSPGGTSTRAVPARLFLPALAREMAQEGADGRSPVDLTPVRVMLINRLSRLPSDGGKIHLSSEYEAVAHTLHESGALAEEAELQVARDCLSVLPRDSAAVFLSPRSPRSLIANLLTDKVRAPGTDQGEATVIRHGQPVRILRRFEQVDWGRMQCLLEASFGRKLNKDAYLTRLRESLDFAVVVGDYEGGAVVTREWAPGETKAASPIAYLDKFALLPALRGSGAVEMLWNAVRKQVYAPPNGPSHQPALSSGRGRDLVWKSRGTNIVNKWYHDRSNGYLKLPSTPFDQTKERWCMFWCDAEDRLARLAEIQQQPLDASASRLPETSGLEDQDDPSVFSLSRRKMWASPRPWAPWGREARPMHTLAVGDTVPKPVPLIAPGEEGRLARWSATLASIPSCWLA